MSDSTKFYIVNYLRSDIINVEITCEGGDFINDYIYMYGQIISTHSFVLEGEFPKRDGCGLIQESNHHIGGETGNATAILASLGCNLKIGGTHLGTKNETMIRDYFQKRGVDISELVYDESFSGVEDYVFISGQDRTCFGEWGNLYRRKDAWYEPVCEESIQNCSCVGFDPLLDAKDTSVVALCKKYDKKFATIDCTYDSEFNRGCAINAISHEFLQYTYGKNIDYRELHKLYTQNSDGLIIFTFGESDLMYGRKDESIHIFQPYSVKVKSTLGAGDSFKAGTIYALAHGMSDVDTVRFASAVASVAITKYPINENPPTLAEVEALLQK